MALIRLSAIERRKVSIFFYCLLLAVVTWLFFALSNNYEYEVKTSVNFKNLPANKAFNPLQSDTVIMTVQGTGWQLLFTRMRIYPRDVLVDLRPLARRNFVTFTEQMKAINNYYSTEQKIIGIQPDTLYFDFTTRKVKKVPLILSNNLSFMKQFGQSGEITQKPDSVTVSGPQENLDKISVWYTDTLKKQSINHTFQEIVKIKSPSEVNISIFPTATEVKIPVEQLTEKVLNVPIKIINNNQYLNVKLVPEKVKVVFMVSLSDFPNVTEDHFEAIVDLNIWKNHKASQLPVTIVRKRAFTRIRRIEPLQVNFMVRN